MNLFLRSRTPGEHFVEKKHHRDDSTFGIAKLNAFQFVSTAVFAFLCFGYWQVMIEDEDIYSGKAEQNRIKSQPLPAGRGRILDRDGRVIVDNISSFSVYLSREAVKELHLGAIAQGLDLDPVDLSDRVRKWKSRGGFHSLLIKEEASPSDIAFVEAHRDERNFPELELIHSQRRIYPSNGLLSHVLGYVGEVSEAELNMAEMARYEHGDIVGKAGIERFYNDRLRGKDGQRQVLVDSSGTVREVLGMTPAEQGQTVQLTIDLDLQAVAELAIENKRASIVAIDPNNGEVLAMASRPAFDSNRFSQKITAKEWREIMDDPAKPMLNRSTQAQLAPGSTFKPLVALAGLEEGVLADGSSALCGGGASYYNHYYRCHSRRGHGSVGLTRALAQSCDVFFYMVGNRLGIDKLHQYATLAGFGQKTGIDLPSEASGLMPSTQWKIRTARSRWFAGETISVAIGQGALTSTPLQLAHATGGIAVGGVWHTPHLLQGEAPARPPRRAEVNLDNIRRVVDGMYAVVQGGTARNSYMPGITFCGKTGTAQLASNDYLKGTAAGRKLKDNAWFVGFAPKEAPEIVVAALFESGEHGNAAATLARDVVKAYFEKKARARKPLPVLPTIAPEKPAASTPVAALGTRPEVQP
jgi:penicillin-binding protein 2